MYFSVTYSKNKKKSTGHALKPKYYKKKMGLKDFFYNIDHGEQER